MTSKWPTVKLKDISTFDRGLTYAKSDETDESSKIVLRATNIDLGSGKLDLSELKYLRDSFEFPSSKLVKPGSIIICTASGSKSHLGKAALIDQDYGYAFGGFMGQLTPSEKLDPKYFYFNLIGSSYLRFIDALTDGSNINNLKFSDLGEFEFPLPPLDEQKRIVAKLDEILGYLNEAEGKIASALVECDALSSAYLDNIFSFEKMPTDQVELQEVTSKIGSGATPRGGNENYKEHGISLIRSMNVHDLKFKHRQLAFLDNAQADQLSNVSVESGDVLLNITGASIARTCVVPDEILPARVNQHVAILRTLRQRLLPEFLALQLVAPTNKYRLLGIGEESGSTRQALTKAMIQEFQIQIPKDTATQKLIIDKCNEMTSIVGNLRERFVKQRDELDSLRSSILSSALAGDF